MMNFSHVYTTPNVWKILQHLDDGRTRYVSKDYKQYRDWINAGNTPEIVPFIHLPNSNNIPDNPWNNIRMQRNTFLSESDWTDLPHAPLSDSKKEAWILYRQSLRDITNQPDPYNIIWPIPP